MTDKGMNCSLVAGTQIPKKKFFGFFTIPISTNVLAVRMDVDGSSFAQRTKQTFLITDIQMREAPMEKVILNCLVHGRPKIQGFSVEIEINKTVSDLREMIKEKKKIDFASVDADQLTLWRVSIPHDDKTDAVLHDLELKNSNKNGIRKLYPLYKIEQVFDEKLADLYIHVIVEPPVTG